MPFIQSVLSATGFVDDLISSDVELEELEDVSEINDGEKDDNSIIIFVVALIAMAAIGFWVFGSGGKKSS